MPHSLVVSFQLSSKKKVVSVPMEREKCSITLDYLDVYKKLLFSAIKTKKAISIFNLSTKGSTEPFKHLH